MAEKIPFVRSKVFLLMVILLLFILILTFFFGDSGIFEIVRAQKKIEELEHTIESLTLERDTLRADIEEMKRNPRSLEATARNKLWLMKKDEQVIVVVPGKGNKKEVGKPRSKEVQE